MYLKIEKIEERVKKKYENGKKVLTEQKIEEINGEISDIKTNVQPIKKTPNPSSNWAGDILTQIKRLSELRDQNVLTEEEFQSKKTELLTKM